MYEIGKVYIWQNQVGDGAYMNGTETTVTGAPITGHDPFSGAYFPAQPTDTLCSAGRVVHALAGRLRPKNPPPGEQLVRDLFAQLPTEAEIQAFKVDEALEDWATRNSGWHPKRQVPMQVFNCRCVPLPIIKPDAT